MKTNSYTILLRRNGYDPFIDFLKGICIFLVVLDHCFIVAGVKKSVFFYLWGSPAVPIFLIIQVFHTYKKGINHIIKTNYLKLWQRIIKPFLFVEIIIILLAVYKTSGNINDLKLLPHRILKYGGLGSGAYYPWIYIQFAIILPFIVPIFLKFKGYYLAIVFILLSEFFEIIFSIFDVPNYIWRLCFFRYIMLFYMGYILASKGYSLNLKSLLLSLISIIFAYIIVYKNIPLSPFVYDTASFKTCHWICYF